ncbi:MAG: class I tRNA ligase family protein, partial [Thermoplasmata archaeon]|nr:class I tRNA ligase family protein [Thermoplasmata archaeon]
PFHTIIWPAMLMGVGGLNIPYDVPANEYMRLGKEKFSKSRGVLVEIPALLEKYDPDALRYYFTIIMPEHRDAEFSWDEFFRKNNDELVSTYGNFVNRVMTFTEKNFGEVPGAKALEKVDEEFLEKTKEMVDGASNDLEKCTFQSALKKVMALASLGNKYFDEKGPWNQIKNDKDACATTMNVSLRAVRTLAIVTAPFLPFSANRLWTMLGCEGNVHAQSWDEAFADIPAGQKFGDIKPLFKKLEPEEEAPSEVVQEVEKAPPKELPEDVPLEVRVGRVLEVGNHPNADKLYLMKVSLGEETRTLVAGLKGHYKPDELEGKSIAILCNLKPAKIRGVESKGMLLAAEDDSNVGVLLAEGAEPGDLIIGKDGAAEIPFSQFQDIVLEVVELEGFEGKRGAVLVWDDKRIILKAGGKPVVVDKDIAAGSRVR